MNADKNRINNVIETALKNIHQLVDVNTIIGKPIQNDNNDIILPVSKITFGVLAGGGEYGKVGIFKKGYELPYSAGNGSIVSISPCGFLVKTKNSDYKILALNNNSVDLIIEKASEFLDRIIVKENKWKKQY